MSQYKTKHINDFTKKELEELGSKDQLIDVRPEEFELGHIKNALLHSVENIETFKQSKIKLTISIVKVVIEVEKPVNFCTTRIRCGEFRRRLYRIRRTTS